MVFFLTAVFVFVKSERMPLGRRAGIDIQSDAAARDQRDAGPSGHSILLMSNKKGTSGTPLTY